jgi:GNAT superfamily N-acetyltransferase
VSDTPLPTEPTGGEGLLTFDRMPADEPPASTLIAAMVDEVSELYGGRIEGEGLPTAGPEELRPPNGACVVGYLDGAPVTVGVVKRSADAIAEIKRMYVAPEGRSRGIARALLHALEAAARDLGYARVRLDTGADQPHAKALYLSAGYTEIPDYNGNPFASFWAEKQL